MVVKVKPEQLDEAIRGQLETYSAEITKNINENLKEVADTTAETLRSEERRVGKECRL